METKICEICGVDISARGNRAYRCEECQKIFRKTSVRNGEMPASARGQYWKYYKHLTRMTDEELMFLFAIKKRDCRYERTSDKILKLRTEMKLIGEAFKRRGSKYDI